MATGIPDVLARVTPHTDRLLATARALDDAAAPSLCEGWTRGHVLTHLARNADGLSALVRSAVDGTGETMYASPQARDDDIEAGAARPLHELVADVEASAGSLAQVLPRLGPGHAEQRLERTPGEFLVKAKNIPFMRLREVVYHHVDLDAGFTFAGVEPDLLRAFIAEEVRRLRALDPAPDLTLRTPEGDEWTVGVGTASVTGSPAALLAWLARGLTGGVAGDPLPRLPKGR
ncbi:maleylpyruvate isomerase family mycothiol-dependent enzyme [Fodinibacter luteus]|uniref:Maleylpyruvate isomerase family mycothiol-dependent enzyme n=1 Tax=Fodinibacter luteus TaxID=552064 RepID=A0ABP8K8M6_9MICO